MRPDSVGAGVVGEDLSGAGCEEADLKVGGRRYIFLCEFLLPVYCLGIGIALSLSYKRELFLWKRLTMKSSD